MNCEEDVKKEVVCESCGGKEVKYRCPSCMRRTCSLQCVKYHKKDFSCSGVRCKTTYVSKTDYNYNNMINDYRFLEDTDRVAYSASSSQKHKQRHLNNSAKTLLRKSRQSGVILKLMPIGMSKRMTNTSYYNNRSKCIMWKVKWLFPQADSEYVNKRVSENEVLIELLETYIDPVQSNPVIRQRLKPYLQTSLDKISVFLKMEYQPANQERYHLLNPSQTLKECLSGKTIIEFPTLHVVLPDKSDMYKVQDTPTRPVPSQHSILDTQPLPETEEMRYEYQIYFFENDGIFLL
ncbi:hypothetical protein QZH41_013865 [Actinostola sp. cb2023]|nr:hypothetical protein QZH41_013865 [Actinostola sp. cb2023]